MSCHRDANVELNEDGFVNEDVRRESEIEGSEGDGKWFVCRKRRRNMENWR